MITSISPLDGRYEKEMRGLSNYFSEYALIKYRVMVEARYLTALSKTKVVRSLKGNEIKRLKNLYQKFSLKNAEEVKKIEKTTKHDVKAVEYFIKKELKKSSLKDVLEFVHFGLTSEDITNLSYSLMVKDFLNLIYLKNTKNLVRKIISLAEQNKKVAMPARTHGQFASPTTLGKEFAVFSLRLAKELGNLSCMMQKIPGKLNCATGNFSALKSACPEIDWINFSRKFVSSLGLTPNLVTTQIEPHDVLCELFQNIVRFNNILIDLDRDMWAYISLDYFKLKVVKGEVGSSTMPQKVNPINFENSEGNLGIANAILNFLAKKLPISRLQRDLTDSTVMRNIGIGFGYSVLAYNNALKGLNKVNVNKEILKQELNRNPKILAEPIQTILRKEGVSKPYEKVKELTRGKDISLKDLQGFVKKVKMSDKAKKEILKLTPSAYIGEAVKLTNLGVKEAKKLVR